MFRIPNNPRISGYNQLVSRYFGWSFLVLILVWLILNKFGINNINLIAYLYIGISSIFVGTLSYKHQVMGGFPDFINHYVKGSAAKIQGVIAVLIGLVFLYLGIRSI